MLLIQVVGLYSDSAPGPDGPAGSDKVGHLLAFAGPDRSALVAVKRVRAQGPDA